MSKVHRGEVRVSRESLKAYWLRYLDGRGVLVGQAAEQRGLGHGRDSLGALSWDLGYRGVGDP